MSTENCKFQTYSGWEQRGENTRLGWNWTSFLHFCVRRVIVYHIGEKGHFILFVYIHQKFQIVAKLNTQNISQITRNMHKQLFMVLAVQTIIPVCISFSPCMMAWYGPMFYLDLGMWNNYFGVIAFSAFPFLDPLAIMFLLPNYRKRIIGSKTSKTPSCTVLQMGHVTPAAN